MVWHQVTIAAANQAMDSLIAKTKGVNVIAPTWFTFSSNSGAYESLADKSYVDRAHEKVFRSGRYSTISAANAARTCRRRCFFPGRLCAKN